MPWIGSGRGPIGQEYNSPTAIFGVALLNAYGGVLSLAGLGGIGDPGAGQAWTCLAKTLGKTAELVALTAQYGPAGYRLANSGRIPGLNEGEANQIVAAVADSLGWQDFKQGKIGAGLGTMAGTLVAGWALGKAGGVVTRPLIRGTRNFGGITTGAAASTRPAPSRPAFPGGRSPASDGLHATFDVRSDHTDTIDRTPPETANVRMGPATAASESSSGILYPTDPSHYSDGSSYVPSSAERTMSSRTMLRYEPVGGGNSNETFRTYLDDGTSGAYKPIGGENLGVRQGIPGPLAYNEVAAARVDEVLGFGRIPATGMFDGPHGPGSHQQWIDVTEGLQRDNYSRIQQEQMAVLDYVIGNSDRWMGNYRTDASGNIVAIDHGYAFPATPDSRFGIRSDFVYNNIDVPFSPEIMSLVRAVDTRGFETMLGASGLKQNAIRGAIARLREIRSRGMITGEAWPEFINTRDLKKQYTALPGTQPESASFSRR